MTKRLLYILALVAAFNCTPAMQISASARIELTDIDNQQIKISQVGNAVVISGAAGKTVYIYNLIGNIVMSVRIDNATEKRIDLSNLPKGIYPVKVGNVSKKIHIGNN
ncbi:MAG: T9SS type A sorting domain-containing protein [Prevotella sp.]|nr:T9SS type A sorting domain-containing protein [Candidatus Prevotella equi]